MTAHRFTQSEIHYLKMLPAVRDATSSRISYSDEFRESATRRYLAGESPVKIFREAGLDPRLIGYKRIERAFARWRNDAPETLPYGQSASSALPSASTPFAPSSRSSRSNRQAGEIAASADHTLNSTASSVPSSPSSSSPSGDIDDEDPRDRLIAKQALRIAELEMQRDQLIEQLKSVY